MADAAIALAVLTAIAAVLDWRIGLVASVVAALSLNYFHTEPRNSFNISSSGDIVAVLLLALGGVSVSLMGGISHRHGTLDNERRKTLLDREDLLEGLKAPVPVTTVWEQVVCSTDPELALLELRLATPGDVLLPRISRRSASDPDEANPDTFVTIPQSGAIAHFRDPRLTERMVLQPRPGVGHASVSRQVLWRFIDDLELVIHRR